MGALGPGDSVPESSPISAPAPLRHNHEAPHLSLPSSAGAANWQRLGDLCFPNGDKDDFKGDEEALTGLGEALTGDGDTLTGDDWRDSPPFSVVPFNILDLLTL